MSKRNLARIIAFQGLYQYHMQSYKELDSILSFSWCAKKNEKQNLVLKQVIPFAKNLIQGTLMYKKTIDDIIYQYSYEDNVKALNPIILSILRLSIYSFFCQKEIHTKIIIDEAIILAKKFAEPEAYKFIHQILDRIQKNRNIISNIPNIKNSIDENT